MDRSRQGKGKSSKGSGSRNYDEQTPSPTGFTQFSSHPTGFVDLLTQPAFYNTNQPQFQYQPSFQNQQSFPNQPPFPTQPQFQNYQQFQYPQYASQPSAHNYRDQPSSDEEAHRDEDTFPVNEVSEESSDPAPRKKNKGKKQEKMKARTWTEDEEVALAQAFVSCSEVPDEQKKASFWRGVLDHFSAQLGGTTRSVHQLNSKHKDLFRKINKFNSIFNRLLSARRSGQSEKDVYTEALAEFKSSNKDKSFQHLRAWEAVRHHIKWAPVPPIENDVEMHSSKRTKTSGSNNYTVSSDAKYPNIEINLDEDNEEPINTTAILFVKQIK